jgi:hypothetical protein
MLEFMYAIIFVACISGFLSLFFSRVRLQRWKLVLSSAPGTLDVLAGAVIGGILSGVIIGPVLTLYFGQEIRPDFSPAVTLPGLITSSAMIVYYIANARPAVDLDLKPLTPYRLWRSSLAAIAALACGVGAAAVIFGTLYATGAMMQIVVWMEHNAQNSPALAALAAGAIYAVPVGIVLGVVIGAGVLLTERWTGTRVFVAAATP